MESLRLLSPFSETAKFIKTARRLLANEVSADRLRREVDDYCNAKRAGNYAAGVSNEVILLQKVRPLDASLHRRLAHLDEQVVSPRMTRPKRTSVDVDQLNQLQRLLAKSSSIGTGELVINWQPQN